MLRVRIPIPRELHAPATYLKEFDEEGEFWSVLKPEIAECIKRRLPEGTVATEGQDTNYFTFPTGERVFVSWRQFAEDAEPDDVVVGPTQSHAQQVSDALLQCLSEPLKSGIQKKVAAIEGRKGYRTALGMLGPEGKALPSEVARNIAKMAASKTVEGGRKKTRRNRKHRKQTKRRRHSRK